MKIAQNWLFFFRYSSLVNNFTYNIYVPYDPYKKNISKSFRWHLCLSFMKQIWFLLWATPKPQIASFWTIFRTVWATHDKIPISRKATSQVRFSDSIVYRSNFITPNTTMRVSSANEPGKWAKKNVFHKIGIFFTYQKKKRTAQLRTWSVY